MPNPLIRGRSGLPTCSRRDPCRRKSKRGRCLWHHSDPLRSAEIGDQPIYCSAFRKSTVVPLCPFGCAIDHTSDANAPFCDGWHKLDPARGRETPRRRSSLARPCHRGRSGLHRRAIGPGSEAADIHSRLSSENRICGQRAATSNRRCKADVAIRSSNVLCSGKIRNGVAHGATKPGKDGRLLGLRRGDRLAFPGCIN